MTEPGVTRRVVKLGGSLLSTPDVIERFRAWLAMQSAAETLLIAGGGELADAVRERHRLQPLADDVAHWLCIRAMQLQAEALAAAVPEAELVAAVADLRATSPRARLAIVDPWRFVRDEDPKLSAAPLPATWDVTSDSIAARLAQLTGANELVLLKSATAPAAHLPQLVAAGYVDTCFPHNARGLPVIRLVNLRDESAQDVVIRQSASTD